MVPILRRMYQKETYFMRCGLVEFGLLDDVTLTFYAFLHDFCAILAREDVITRRELHGRQFISANQTLLDLYPLLHGSLT